MLRTGSPLANDLLVLLTDGEEVGLVGAAGFVRDHPDLSDRVGILLNLEARGSSGPALMFETSDQSGWLIAEFARTAPYPLASSLMYSIYRLLPNDTDLTELKKTGVGAFNFAFTETVRNYHSANDTLANLDPRSVQHMGMNTLALARHFGNLPLTDVRKSDCIYFNWIGSHLLVYPAWGAWILVAATLLLMTTAFLLGHRRGLLRLSLKSLGAFFLLLLFTSGGMLLAWGAITLAIGDSLGEGDTVANKLFFALLVALGFLLGARILRWQSARIGARTLAGGLLIGVALLSVITLGLLAGASYVLQWPCLLGTGSLLLGLRARGGLARASWGLLTALPVLLLLAPLAYLFFVNLGLNFVSLGDRAAAQSRSGHGLAAVRLPCLGQSDFGGQSNMKLRTGAPGRPELTLGAPSLIFPIALAS